MITGILLILSPVYFIPFLKLPVVCCIFDALTIPVQEISDLSTSITGAALA